MSSSKDPSTAYTPRRKRPARFHKFEQLPIELQFMVIERVPSVCRKLQTAANTLHSLMRVSPTLKTIAEPIFTKVVARDYDLTVALMKAGIEGSAVEMVSSLSKALMEPDKWAGGELLGDGGRRFEALMEQVEGSVERTVELDPRVLRILVKAVVDGETTRLSFAALAFMKLAALRDVREEELGELLAAMERRFNYTPRSALEDMFCNVSSGPYGLGFRRPSGILFNSPAIVKVLMEYKLEVNYLLADVVQNGQLDMVNSILDIAGAEAVSASVIKAILPSPDTKGVCIFRSHTVTDAKQESILRALLTVPDAKQSNYAEALGRALAESNIKIVNLVLDHYDKYIWTVPKSEFDSGLAWRRFMLCTRKYCDKSWGVSFFDEKLELLYSRGFRIKGVDHRGLHKIWTAKSNDAPNGFSFYPTDYTDVVTSLISRGATVTDKLVLTALKERPVFPQGAETVTVILKAYTEAPIDPEINLRAVTALVALYSGSLPPERDNPGGRVLRRYLDGIEREIRSDKMLVIDALAILKRRIERKVEKEEEVLEGEIVGPWMLANSGELARAQRKKWGEWWEEVGREVATRVRKENKGPWGKKVPIGPARKISA